MANPVGRPTDCTPNKKRNIINLIVCHNMQQKALEDCYKWVFGKGGYHGNG